MKNDNILTLCLMLATSLLLSACSGEGDEHDHETHKNGGGHEAHAEVGPNGGHILELGSVGHLEYVHDAAAGSVTMFFTGPDLKKSVTPDQPPELKLSTDEGPLVLTLSGNEVAGSSRFSVTNDALKTGHPKGRISIKIAGLVFNPDLEETHAH